MLTLLQCFGEKNSIKYTYQFYDTIRSRNLKHVERRDLRIKGTEKALLDSPICDLFRGNRDFPICFTEIISGVLCTQA